MKKNWLSAGLTAALLAVAAAVPAEAAVFKFTFDSTFDGTVTPPYVGAGTFSFDGAATAGTYALSSLSNFAFDFTIHGVNFTNANLSTPVNHIAVSIASLGQDLVVNFGGSGGGLYGGSADFTESGSQLSFQPNFGSLFFSGSAYGTYQGILDTSHAVPEPMSAALVLFGLAGVAASRRRRA
ncbi:PEP-CTERM sorting domain-containing protein [Azohydromonas lata]|uniref:PEP-CTERM sorting domain-containing protein n=1 Tax=Azohydromonas lata TaxID=45677 RepID=UPI00082EB668|nr:PEP-CTERM sorting domain-containing protein [Azohydromonas lata]